MELASIIGNWYEAYKAFQGTHPHLGAMLTAEAIYISGDVVSQLIKDKKVNGRKLGYTATLAPVYGLCLEGLIETGELVGEHISEHPLAKAALGPNLFGNFFNMFFFVNNTVGEKMNYRVTELINHYKSLFSNFKERFTDNIPGRQYAYSVIGTLTAWNGFQSFNYAYVDDEMRTAATLGAAFVWTAALSLWSLAGSRRISYTEGDK